MRDYKEILETEMKWLSEAVAHGMERIICSRSGAFTDSELQIMQTELHVLNEMLKRLQDAIKEAK